MDAQLQKAVVDYEQGQTYPPGSKERTELPGRASPSSTDLYKQLPHPVRRADRPDVAGQVLRGAGRDRRRRSGIYNELLEHPDPRLRPLQRYVGYFQIIALAKRKEYALAADEAAAGSRRTHVAKEQRSQEGLGVQLELAKNIVAQMPGVTDAAEQRGGRHGASPTPLGEVVRYASPYKAEALGAAEEVQADGAAANAEEVARLSYEEAVNQADQAIAAHEWDRAIALLKAAVRKADPRRDPDKANRARYNLAFCYYMNKQYLRGDVLAEHLARRYPQAGLSAKATEIGMAVAGRRLQHLHARSTARATSTADRPGHATRPRPGPTASRGTPRG